MSETPNTPEPMLTRRALLGRGAVLAGGLSTLAPLGHALLEASEASAARATPSHRLQAQDPMTVIFAAARHHRLVALTERHMLQEWHDLFAALVLDPRFPLHFDTIVVEFGNAAYQHVVDRYLAGELIGNAKLRQVWRQIGDPTWNAPVYEEFFRLVRGLNRTLPPRQHVRVLLGQPPITMDQVLARPHDRRLVRAYAAPLDEHYTTLVEQQVIARGKRALLVAGKGHLLRGILDDQRHPNAITRLAHHNPFVIDNLVLPPQAADPASRRVAAELGHGTTPRVAFLDGTWLGNKRGAAADGWINEMAYRAASGAAKRYGVQADAIVYFGPGAHLTASRPDPAIYSSGRYATELRRLGPIVGPYLGSQKIDLVALGRAAASAGPSWFAG